MYTADSSFDSAPEEAVQAILQASHEVTGEQDDYELDNDSDYVWRGSQVEFDDDEYMENHRDPDVWEGDTPYE